MIITYVAHSSQSVMVIYRDNPTCSENLVQDTSSNTLSITSQAKVTCSENIAYATVKKRREDSTGEAATSHTVLHEEAT